MTNGLHIRRALNADLPAIVEIYNQAIRSRRCTCDTGCYTTAQRQDWFDAHDDKTPVFVCEKDGRIVAFVSLSAYRPGRQALAGVCELSYYVDFAYHRQGIGRAVVCYAVEQAKILGYIHCLAVVLSCNESSMALLASLGFERWGCLPGIAFFGENRYSHLYYGHVLSEQI